MVVVAIAESLDRMGLDIAEAVVDRARTEIVKIPSVAQLYEVAREVRIEVEAREFRQPALPAGEEVAAWPPEVAEKVHAMIEGHKVIVEEQIAVDTAEWERIKRDVAASARLAGVCDGSGKDAMMVNGEWCCPGCGEPLEVSR